MLNLSDMERISEDIEKIFRGYLEIPSFSNTEKETMINDYFLKVLSEAEYFRSKPHLMGSERIPGDSLGRSVNWGLVLGQTTETIVMIHHTDVVNTDNFGIYEDIAFYPNELEKAYLGDERFLDEESREDLLSKNWFFGRGTADMKGGGAIQLALLKYYSASPEKCPSILVMGVPDEENHSLGMRHGVTLMKDLKTKFKLQYQLMINSEPHQRMRAENGVISQGSIGKMNAFVHVRGVLAHGGKALEGVNPNGMMGTIVSALDLNEALIDRIPGEMSIPPTWVYLRDYKKQYDISFPESTYGILNVLNFYTSPGEVLERIREVCTESFEDYIKKVNGIRNRFSKETNRNWDDLKWKAKVFTLKEFLKETGTERIEKYPEDIERLLKSFKYNGPVVIIGFLPPYYPGVSNKDQKKILSAVNDFTGKMWNQAYDNRQYFTGISDLSYSSSSCSPEDMDKQMENMIGWKSYYDIPFKIIAELSMDSVNVGPWGKDFHRPTERVFKEDLLFRTPMIIDKIIMNLLGGEKNV